MLSKKTFFILVWVLLLVLSVISPVKEFKFVLASKNQVLLIGLFQRILGLLAFTLLFIQIFLGAFMGRLTEKLGEWVFNFHLFNGKLLYTLILLHPALYMLYLFKIEGVLDPFYIYSDLCVLCKGNLEHFYNFGRVAFWLITAGIIAAVFRASDPFLKKNWRKFHILNYFAFFLIAIHSKVLGTDISTTPFKWIYLFGIVTVSLSLVVKYILPLFKGKK
ncbi:MAG: hypothetical protein ABIJ85_00205 [bacterium]